MKHQFLKQLTLEMQFVREMAGFHGQVVDFEQLIRETPPVYGQTEHFESTVLSNKDHSSEQDSLAPQKAKLHADSQKLVKPNSGIARCEL